MVTAFTFSICFSFFFFFWKRVRCFEEGGWGGFGGEKGEGG